MIILGLDPGLADTGYGLVDCQKGECRFVACGVIKTPSGEALAGRLAQLAGELKKIIKKFNPGLAAVEEIFFAKNAKTAIAVSQARGALVLTAKQAGCQIREFTPLQVKMALTGYGRASKAQMQKMVKAILRLAEIPKPDDAADALAVAICAAQTNNKVVSVH